jgi:hypothetical protein
MKSSRTATLDEVAARTRNTEEFWFYLRDFLDGFYRSPEASAFTEQPRMLAPSLDDGDRLDAYLAAVAEYLSQKFQLPIPAWTQDRHRILAKPYFAFDTYEGRLFLLAESPSSFRARNIFVSADALNRV